MNESRKVESWSEPKSLGELAAEANATSPVQGIPCGKCHNTAWRVYYTRLGLGIVKRKRVCLTCSHESVTHEKQVGRAG